MTAIATIVWVINLLADTAGQLCFKAAALSASEKEGWNRWQSMLKGKWLWLGVVAYVFEILLWLALLSMIPLSVAILLGCLNILCVMFGGKLFFSERITRQRMLAVALITMGVALVGWS